MASTDGGAAHAVVFVPGHDLGFLTKGGVDFIDAFDPRTLRVIKRIAVAADPDAAVYDPATRRLYVAGGTSQTATLVDVDSLSVSTTISLPGHPEFAALDAVTGLVYQNLNDRDAMAIVDLAKGVVVETKPLPGCKAPTGLAIDGVGRRLFVVCSGNARMVVFDITTFLPVASISVGQLADSVAFDGSTHRIYVACGAGELTVVSQQTRDVYRVVDRIRTQLGAHHDRRGRNDARGFRRLCRNRVAPENCCLRRYGEAGLDRMSQTMSIGSDREPSRVAIDTPDRARRRNAWSTWRCIVALLGTIAAIELTIDAIHAPAALQNGLARDMLFVGRVVPTRGATRFEVDAIPAGSALAGTGIERGDMLHWKAPMGRWDAVAKSMPSMLTVTRGEATWDVALRPRPDAPVLPDQVANYVVDTILRVTALVIGVLIGWRRAGSTAMRSFAAAGLLAAIAYPHSAPSSAHIVALDFIASVSHDLWPTALLLFAIHYPVDRPSGARALFQRIYPWLLGLHVAAAVAFNARLYDGFFEPTIASALGAMSISVSLMFFACVLMGWHEARGAARVRFNWILATLGTLTLSSLVGPLITVIGLPPLSAGLRIVVPMVQLTAMVGLIYAILKHRLLDFAVAVNRTLVFTIVGAILLGLIQVANGFVGSFLHYEDRNKTILLGALLAVFASTMLQPLKRLVERGVDRLFFTQWAAREIELLRFIEDAAYIGDATALRRSLVAAIDRFVDSIGCAVFMRQDRHYVLADGTLSTAPLVLGLDDPLVVAMRSRRMAVEMPLPWCTQGPTLALPMATRGDLHGFVVITPGADGRPHRPDQAQSLGTAVIHVGSDFYKLQIDELQATIDRQQARFTSLEARLAAASQVSEHPCLKPVLPKTIASSQSKRPAVSSAIRPIHPTPCRLSVDGRDIWNSQLPQLRREPENYTQLVRPHLAKNSVGFSRTQVRHLTNMRQHEPPTSRNIISGNRMNATKLASYLLAGTLGLSALTVSGASHGRWCRDGCLEGHHRQCGELERPYDSGRSRKSCWPRGDVEGKGPFTVFAPTNEAFAALPAGTVDTLLKPESKAALTRILTYHVVAGDVDAASLLKAIAAGGGKATLKTVAGGTLTAMKSGSGITVTDEKGGVANVTIADVKQSNGVIHVIDKVLLPN